MNYQEFERTCQEIATQCPSHIEVRWSIHFYPAQPEAELPASYEANIGFRDRNSAMFLRWGASPWTDLGWQAADFADAAQEAIRFAREKMKAEGWSQ